jgi:hypothetical protein
MKTMTAEKPARSLPRPKTTRRGGSPQEAKTVERVPVDPQVAEFERTFTVRWEW